MLAARETAGMLISYSYGLHFTEYASFPCEGVYICTNPIVYDPVTHIQVDKFVPYYDVSRSKVTCRSASHGDDDKKLKWLLILVRMDPHKRKRPQVSVKWWNALLLWFNICSKTI